MWAKGLGPGGYAEVWRGWGPWPGLRPARGGPGGGASEGEARAPRAQGQGPEQGREQGRGGRAPCGGLAVPRLGRASVTLSRAEPGRERERRRRQDEQHQERAGAGAEPQAGPQPGGRARAVRQDPGERRGLGRAGGALSPAP